MKIQKTLHLSLSKELFQVMLTGEKNGEFRKPSDWIKSRLFHQDGSRKDYDVVKFTHGYKKNAPFFIAIFDGFNSVTSGHVQTYTNGLVVEVENGDIVIHLGEVIKKGNIKPKSKPIVKTALLILVFASMLFQSCTKEEIKPMKSRSDCTLTVIQRDTTPARSSTLSDSIQ